MIATAAGLASNSLPCFAVTSHMIIVASVFKCKFYHKVANNVEAFPSTSRLAF